MKISGICMLIVLLAICLSPAGRAAADNSDETQQRIADLNRVIVSTYDEMEGITWYRHKDEDRVSGFGFYIGEKDGQAWLRFYAGTSGDGWVHFDRIILLGKFEDAQEEPVRMEIAVDPSERVEDVVETAPHGFTWGGVYCNEVLDIMVDARIDLESFRKLAATDSVKIRFSGPVTYREAEVKDKWVRAITDVLDYWELVITPKDTIG